MISIDTIEIRNFLGFADYTTKISLSKYFGISLITGMFEEAEFTNLDDEKRIGAGKSSLIEAVSWCLFGHLTYLEKPGDAVINWNTGKNCFVRITTTDGYEITRTRKMVNSNELIINKDGEDLTRSTTSPSQEYLNSLFKIDYRSFVTSVLFGQFNEGFLNVSDAKRRLIFERFIKITSFNAIASTAKDKVIKLDGDVIELESKIESLNSSKESIENEINNLLAKAKDFDIDKEKKIEVIKSKLPAIKVSTDSDIDKIKSDIKNINEKINTFVLIDVEDVRSEWAKYDDQRTKNEKNSIRKAELSGLKAKLDQKLSSITFEIKSHDSELSRIKIIDESALNESWAKFNAAILKTKELQFKLIEVNKLINNSEFEIDKLSVDIENIVDVKSLQVCDKCYNVISGEHIEKVACEKRDELTNLNSKLPGLKEIVSKINTKILELESIDKPEITIDVLRANIEKVSSLKSKIELLNNSCIKLKAAVMDAQNQINLIEIVNIVKPSMTIDEAVNQKNIYDNLKKSIELKESNIVNIKNNFKQKIIDIQNEINRVRSSDNPYISIVSDKKSELDNIIIKIANESDELSKTRKIRQHVDYIRDSYYNKKKMRAFWISEIVPTFNKFIKYYFNFFEIEDKVEFDEFLNVKFDKWGYKTHSGGEKRRIDLSIMFSLNDLHVSVFGPQCNLMVLDEVDGRIDPFTTNRLVALLNDDIIKRGNGLTNIFVISHKEIMKDKFPNRIIVKNKGGNSYIVN